MLRSGNRIAAFSVLLALLALLALTARNDQCASSDHCLHPWQPFKTPVNLAREGVVADFDIRVIKYDFYYFKILFGFPEGDQAERERIRKIVGGLHEPAPVPAPVKLTIFKKQAQDEQIYYQKIIEKLDTDSYSVRYFAATLGKCILPRGEYRFVLESLASSREYESIAMFFRISVNPKTMIDVNRKNKFSRSKSC